MINVSKSYCTQLLCGGYLVSHASQTWQCTLVDHKTKSQNICQNGTLRPDVLRMHAFSPVWARIGPMQAADTSHSHISLQLHTLTQNIQQGGVFIHTQAYAGSSPVTTGNESCFDALCLVSTHAPLIFCSTPAVIMIV